MGRIAEVEGCSIADRVGLLRKVFDLLDRANRYERQLRRGGLTPWLDDADEVRAGKGGPSMPEVPVKDDPRRPTLWEMIRAWFWGF